MDKLEAASDAWLAALREVFARRLDGLDLTGVRVAFCEEYRDPPRHLVADGAHTLTWHVLITDQGVTVGRGLVPDPALAVEADYDAVLRLAHLSDTSPEWPHVVAELEEKGLFRRTVEPSRLPPTVAAALAGVHDEMIDRTR